eukprot:TRINITY_DN49429_c0_g1_i1.p1 TRINITY_DN49429_c0_g1~~TRINITY_DN49429_c0_g1_i1.p1  ORF type:complete len:420 (+),score=70.28 TRINITY_DN49429_c0_g1_i1:164-1261(+)
MDAVDNQQPKNPSAITWSFVRKIREKPQALRLEYLRRHLDDRCNEAIAQLSLPEQEFVASQVDILKCRNLSAFVFSQIRSARERGALGLLAAAPTAAPIMPFPMQMMQMQMPTMGMAPMAPLAFNPALYPAMHASMAAHSFPVAAVGPRDRSRSPGVLPGVGGSTGVRDLDMRAMALRAQLDANATKAVSELNAEEQRIVMGLVAKQECRNPSAVAWSMVKRIRENPSEAKREFFKSFLESEALALFERLADDAQESILSSVEVVSCRNIYGLIQSRVNEMCAGTAYRDEVHVSSNCGGNRTSPGTSGPQALAAQMGLQLDAKCLQALGELSHEDQVGVLQEADPSTCRNPSAFVWSRIKLLKEI